jgi:outer membrane usher protein
MRHPVRLRATFTYRHTILMLLLSLIPVCSYATETVIMKVYVNTADQGEYFLQMTPEGEMLASPQDLRKMGFKELPKDVAVEVEGERYIPLHSLAPGASFEIDQREAVLRIMAAPDLLEQSVIDLGHKRSYEVFRTRDNSAFLNYGIQYNLGDDVDFTSLGLPLEVGANIGGWLGLSSFSYAKSDTEEKFRRIMTSLTKDDTRRQRRYVLGDFSASSGALGGGGTFGGLSISKNFSMTPFFIRSPSLDVSGSVETPSDVEVYVNGHLVETRHLPPGEFEFKNLPGATGYGETVVVIRDAFGREQRLEGPFYISAPLLRRGLQEYSYNLGFKREALGTESFQYGDAAFLGFHRLGLTDSLTVGARAEASAQVVSFGIGAKFLVWSGGEVDTSVAASRDHGRDGYAGSLSYAFTGKAFNTRFYVNGFTRDYANLNLTASVDKPRFEGAVSLGYNRKSLGSISATYSVSDKWTGTDTERTSLFYSRRLNREISLFARASRIETDAVANEAFVGLNFFLGAGRAGGLGYGVQGGVPTASVSMNKNPPVGVGSGYRFLVDRKEGNEGKTETGGNGSVSYNGPYGIYTADLRRTGEKNNYGLKASGAMAFINRSVYLSRPITDSFALVKVGNIKDVSVSLSNQKTGVTNNKGEVLVPGLISYYDNRLSIDDKDIPVNYDIQEISKYVSTPLRGGGVVRFDVRKLQAFLGRFFVVERGKKTPAEYWGLVIELPDRKVEVTVGKNAEFYLENLPTGTWPARLFVKGKECRFDMAIPDSDEMMVDMGEVSCENN